VLCARRLRLHLESFPAYALELNSTPPKAMKKLTNRESHPMAHDSISFGHTTGKDLTL